MLDPQLKFLPATTMSSDSNFPARKLVSRRLDAFGFDMELIKTEPWMVNTLGTLRDSRGASILLFDGHYDIVPIGNIDFWSVDPFEGAVKGRIYGRGVGDMKGVIASTIISTKALVKSDAVMRREFSIRAVADEEYLTK